MVANGGLNSYRQPDSTVCSQPPDHSTTEETEKAIVTTLPKRAVLDLKMDRQEILNDGNSREQEGSGEQESNA
jgi:hypothetical protein